MSATCKKSAGKLALYQPHGSCSTTKVTPEYSRTMSPPPDAHEKSPGVFATTHWSVVVQAGDQDSPTASAALEKLCATYWYPVYAEIRRRGHSPPDAQDLTQDFFACLLRRNSFASAD